METLTEVESQQPNPAQCWCCGLTASRDAVVRLGIHPEVVVCIRCAHPLSKWPWEIEDRDRTGLGARGRDGIRRVRKTVVSHGWHQNKLVGRGLRWLGRFTP